MILLDGRKIASEIKEEIKQKVEILKSENAKIPHLAIILVGNDGGSETYVANKLKSCELVGFQASLFRYEVEVSENAILQKIKEINLDAQFDGLIVQLPLPKHISVEKVTETINPAKDVDGFHPINVGRMTKSLPAYISATPYGIVKLLEKYQISAAGKHCVVVGRSPIVGTPMSILMSRDTPWGNCTVTLCHSHTKNIENFTKQADILVVAMGKPNFIKANMVKEGAIVIDVGITRVTDATKQAGYTLVGDVKFDEVAPKCSYITPVPGGVGAMTIAALLYNTLLAAEKKIYFEGN